MQARIGVFQRDAQVVTQVRPARGALASATGTSATHEVAKQVVEHVGKGAGEIALPTAHAAAGARAAHAAFKRGMTEAIIGRLLVGVFQRIIGFARLFELAFRVGVVSIAVGVKFLGLLAVGLFDLFRRGALG